MTMNAYINMYIHTHSYTEIGGEGKEKGEIIKDNLMAGGPHPAQLVYWWGILDSLHTDLQSSHCRNFRVDR